MLNKAFVILILLCSFLCSYSQIQGIVVDKLSGKPVPYANIWVENEEIGVSAEEDGSFTLDKAVIGKFLIISAVAYQRQRVEIINELSKVSLIPLTYQLPEVVIREDAMHREVSTFKSTNHSYQTTRPAILARYFPYFTEYEPTPYLSKITFEIVSRGQPSKYRVRLFSVNEKGEPGDDLIPNQLLGITKYRKVTHEEMIDLDLRKYSIKLPENGFFIGFEFITLKKRNHAFQLVGIRAKTVKDALSTWSYWGGIWHKITVLNDELQFKLTLSE